MSHPGQLIDTFGRTHNNLRISVTDRCNIRCFYCMPEDNPVFVQRREILTFEEIERFVRVAVRLGINKLRLTGGEPLVRRDLPVLVRKLAAIPEITDLALKTNGLLLPELARPLYDAGLRRINVHLDTLNRTKFEQIVRRPGFERVLEGIFACKRLGFDIIEISSGFISISTDDWLRLVEKVQKAGLKAKPEVGIQFGAGGASAAAELAAEGTRDPDWAIAQARRFLEAGAYMIMVESEGITENVQVWRTEVPAKFVNALGLERVMFEAAEPEVFAWYVKNYGPEVNLFVDHSQIVQLECLRSGIWGTKSLWGRILTYKG
jgi:phosphosulfolactate synthase (CoM biosynthesis protein A)